MATQITTANMQQFEATLRAMMSHDNAVRGPAEKAYSGLLKTQADLVGTCLMGTALKSAHKDLQEYAPVLLRRVCSLAVWVRLSKQTRDTLCGGLLQGLTSNAIPIKTKRLFGNCVSDLSLVLVAVSEDDDADTQAGKSYTESTGGAEALNREWPGM